MKFISLFLILFIFSFNVSAATIKTVCHDSVVKGKIIRTCKTIKVHKILIGTKVPPIKKNKKILSKCK